MLAVITGSFSGIGLNPFPTLDWNVVTSLVDPVVTPFFATANIAFGMFIVGLVFLPAIYFTNVSMAICQVTYLTRVDLEHRISADELQLCF